MVVKVCPRCQQNYTCDEHNTDYVHDCGNNTEASLALRQEDVKVIGNWQDYTGSGTAPPSQLQTAGAENKLWGTRAALEGAKTHDLSERGKIKTVYRQRDHEEYIDLS